jgi:hypothetical protein
VHEYSHTRHRIPTKPRLDNQNYPVWLKGFAQFLYSDRGLQRMQVQGALYAITGFDVHKTTLSNWLYRDDLRKEKES